MEGEKRRFRNYRPRTQEAKPEFPEIPKLPMLMVTAKHIGYWHMHRGFPLADIARQFRGLDMGDMHIGYGLYLKNQKAIDAELREELRFNRNSSLDDLSIKLPGIGLGSLVDSMQAETLDVELPKKTPAPASSEVVQGTTKRRGLGIRDRLKGMMSGVLAPANSGK